MAKPQPLDLLGFFCGELLRYGRWVVHYLTEDHRSRCRQRPPRPLQVQGARVPMADALLPRRCRIDRLQRDDDLDQFLAAFDGVGGYRLGIRRGKGRGFGLV